LITLDPALTGQDNMDRDRAILSAAEDSSFCGRLYFWDQPTVSLGRFQRAEDVVLGGLPSVLRPTGGAAVLHGHDLTFSLAAPLEQIGATPREVRLVYRALVRPIVIALAKMGIPAALGEDVGVESKSNSAYCFALHSKNDVISTDTGKKLCGCALRVTDRAALLQASIPIQAPVRHPRECIVGGEDPAWIEVSAGALSDALVQACHSAFGS
jgi:lipoate-protein ligase A